MKNYLKMFLGVMFVFSLILVGSFTFASNALAVDAWASHSSAGSRSWSSITSNSTGQYLAAVVYATSYPIGGYIYTSANHGNT